MPVDRSADALGELIAVVRLQIHFQTVHVTPDETVFILFQVFSCRLVIPGHVIIKILVLIRAVLIECAIRERGRKIRKGSGHRCRDRDLDLVDRLDDRKPCIPGDLHTAVDPAGKRIAVQFETGRSLVGRTLRAVLFARDPERGSGLLEVPLIAEVVPGGLNGKRDRLSFVTNDVLRLGYDSRRIQNRDLAPGFKHSACCTDIELVSAGRIIADSDISGACISIGLLWSVDGCIRIIQAV